MQLVRDQRWRGQDFVGFPFHHARRLMFLAHTCPMRNPESAITISCSCYKTLGSAYHICNQYADFSQEMPSLPACKRSCKT
jgi:hypothetical protein